MERQSLVALTADIVAAHVSNNHVSVNGLASLIGGVHAALASLGTAAAPEKQEKTPAVSVRASLKPDYIVCLECGKKQKTLKRHLQAAHGMTPQQYRADYGLPDSYPMVAPDYSERRRSMAKSIGLGRKKANSSCQPQRHSTGFSWQRKWLDCKIAAAGSETSFNTRIAHIAARPCSSQTNSLNIQRRSASTGFGWG